MSVCNLSIYEFSHVFVVALGKFSIHFSHKSRNLVSICLDADAAFRKPVVDMHAILFGHNSCELEMICISFKIMKSVCVHCSFFYIIFILLQWRSMYIIQIFLCANKVTVIKMAVLVKTFSDVF